jgi:hypothetical protein
VVCGGGGCWSLDARMRARPHAPRSRARALARARPAQRSTFAFVRKLAIASS